jgi:hypothetical protein
LSGPWSRENACLRRVVALAPGKASCFLIRWRLFLKCALCIVPDAFFSVGAAPVYEDRSGERREEGGLAASRLQLRFF